jgi:hypothetical protein
MRPVCQKTLDELEGVAWGPAAFPSHLVQTCHRLRTKPIGEFGAEDLRIMIGQQIGLAYLLPLALERLEADPWAAGDMYPGDLLKTTAVARFPWDTHPELRARLIAVLDRALGELPSLRRLDADGLPDLDVPGPELAVELATELGAVRARLKR